jgi:MFS family permease
MRINHAIKVLITSDFAINAGFSLFAPVFAIYVTQQVSDGSAQVVGFAAAITQIVKSSFQIPIAKWLDKNHGEYDDFYAMVTGSFIIASIPFLYLFVDKAVHIYMINVLYGIGAALAIPPWYAIFTRHIDKLQENVEWSFDSVAIGISGAGAAALSGIIVDNLGFEYAFVLGGLLAILGASLQIKIFKDLHGFVGRHEVRPSPRKSSG